MKNNTCFIKSPNLPQQDTALAAVSCRFPVILEKLNQIGVEVLPIKPCEQLPEPINSHADIQFIHMFDSDVIIAKNQTELSAVFQTLGFSTVETPESLGSFYPQDSLLNAVRLEHYLIANRKVCSISVLEACKAHKLTIIPVNQGYAKCSTLVVDEHSIITADPGIAAGAKDFGLQVLKIRPGFIRLNGYEYGFIGGCGGKIGKNKLALTGNLMLHPDGPAIRHFITSCGVEIIQLTDQQLIDIGGIIPLKESIKLA